MVLADSLHKYSLIFADTSMTHGQQRMIGLEGWKGFGMFGLESGIIPIFGVGGLESELNLIVTINNIIYFQL